jgi:exopolysaccharide biosynthesis protein
MCWEIDYKFFADQKKAQEAQIKQEQRAGIINQLLNEANKQTEAEGTSVKEVSPAE